MTSPRAPFHAPSRATLRARADVRALAIVTARVVSTMQAVVAPPRSPGPGRP